ncbi:MAG TPA: ABC transporter substrate-binding protein [Methylomirabilota bacterium]
MNRRTFLSAVTGGLLGAPLATGAPQAGRISRVGWLSPDAAPAGGAMLGALRDGLRELGYADGQNIQFEPRWAERQIGRLPVLAEDLVRLKVQVIVAWGYPSIMAAKGATATIPIVFLTHFDPVEAGFVASLARPGGNVTGRTFMSPDLSAKRLQLLREVTPGVSHVALMANTATPGTQSMLAHFKSAADTLGVKLELVEPQSPDEFESTFATMVRKGVGALHVNLDPLFMGNRPRLIQLAMTYRLPATYDVRQFVDSGGLMSYGPSFLGEVRRAAILVDKILKGARPADLPVEQPTKLELVINLKTAKALGLTIPPSLLVRADQVIE